MLRRNKAFTLAEVLITLGIIGVVAALTIPILINKSQDLEQKNQFKNFYSTLHNAINGIKVDFGSYLGCYYALPGGSGSVTDCSTFYTELRNRLKIIKTCDNNSYSNGCIPFYADMATAGCSGFSQANLLSVNKSYVLADGSIIIEYVSKMPLIAFDINGNKSPNKWGHDLFIISFSGNQDVMYLTTIGCYTPEAGGKTTANMLRDSFD